MANSRKPIRSTINAGAFDRIEKGTKKMEFRLRKDKWKDLRAGDTIEFSHEQDPDHVVKVNVLAVLNYSTFAELLEDFDPVQYCGKRDKDEQLDGLLKEHGDSTKGCYTQEQEQQHTVLGIKIEVIG